MENKHENGRFILLLIITLFIANQYGLAQKPFGNYFLFEENVRDNGIKQTGFFRCRDIMLNDARERYRPLIKGNADDSIAYLLGTKTSPKTPIILGFKLNPKLEDYWGGSVVFASKKYRSFYINDSSDAILIALGITSENMADYKYHVVENDSLEIVPWSSIPVLEQKYGALKPYAFFGKFNAPGKQLLIEVVNSKNYSIRDGIIFDWRIRSKPAVTQIVALTSSDFFNIQDKEKNRSIATDFDSILGIPLDMRFVADSIETLRIYFKNHFSIPYTISLKKDINGAIEMNELEFILFDSYYDLDKNHFEKPGKYELIIHRTDRDEVPEYETLRIHFEVLPPIQIEKFTARQIFLFALGVIIIITTVFLVFYIRNRRKLFKSIRLKEKNELELKSIRSQLNPHFMFNALSSIQNLMIKKDIDLAKHYLSIFSSLTRRVLNSGELISLEDEICLLDDYLQMEQLRFNFEYSIHAEESLNKANIEIPMLLLQPLVENAVKHGVSSMHNKGNIEVLFTSQNKDLLLSVADNGKGFLSDTNNIENNSLGIKLSKERIDLLNKIYLKQIITLEYLKIDLGTKVVIRLNEWL